MASARNKQIGYLERHKCPVRYLVCSDIFKYAAAFRAHFGRIVEIYRASCHSDAVREVLPVCNILCHEPVFAVYVTCLSCADLRTGVQDI